MIQLQGFQQSVARPRPSAGFTLLELLVAMGIVALLAALAPPAVQGAQSARRTSCAQQPPADDRRLRKLL